MLVSQARIFLIFQLHSKVFLFSLSLSPSPVLYLFMFLCSFREQKSSCMCSSISLYNYSLLLLWIPSFLSLCHQKLMFSCTYIMCIAISSILHFSHLLCHERLCIPMLCIRDGEFGNLGVMWLLVSSFYMESLWCVVAASFLSVISFVMQSISVYMVA
jgi:hypothetical protein